MTLLAYLATAGGLPIPAGPPRRPSTPFPCQDHACGCQSPEECWGGCCCLTPAQRWAWARRNHVEPPAYAAPPTAASNKRSASWRRERQRDRDRTPSAGTKKPAAADPRLVAIESGSEPDCPDCPSCTHERDSAPEAKPCCQAPENGSPDPSAPSCHASKSARGKVRWGLSVQARRCKGLATTWVAHGAALPTPLPPRWRPVEPLIERVLLTKFDLLHFAQPPDIPPPRSARV